MQAVEARTSSKPILANVTETGMVPARLTRAMSGKVLTRSVMPLAKRVRVRLLCGNVTLNGTPPMMTELRYRHNRGVRCSQNQSHSPSVGKSRSYCRSSIS